MAYFDTDLPLVSGNGGVGGEIQRGFDTQSILSKLDGINSGICDGFYAQNTNILNGFSGVQQALCQGFSGINSAIYQSGTDTRFAINELGYRLQDCCCQTQRAIDGVNANIYKSTCDIVNANNSNTQRIIDFMTSEKISSLQLENQALKFQASQASQNAFITANQEAQTAELIRRLGRDCPIPAYVVPNPNCCYPNNNSCCGCN